MNTGIRARLIAAGLLFAVVVGAVFLATQFFDGDSAPSAAPETTASTTTAAPVTTTSSPETTTTAAPFAGQEINVGVWLGAETRRLKQLTAERFTAETGIAVNFVELDQELVRAQFTSESAEVRLDAMMLSSFEAPLLGLNGWAQDLTPLAEADVAYDVDDLLPPIRDVLSADGALYGAPFSGESSFLMYNRAIMNEAGVTVPAEPTWNQIAEIAERVHSDEVAGICLNGLTGWDELGASLTPVVNTFGGTWWEANGDGAPGEPQINQTDSGFRAATEFYVNLTRDFGPENAGNTGDPQCFELMQSGSAAMWFGPTNSPSLLEDGALTGNLGIAPAPTGPSGLSGGGLLATAFAIPAVASNPEAAWEFIGWATSEEFVTLVGETDGWQAAPPGTRFSTYDNPDYLGANEAFASEALTQILAANPTNPGTTPRPGVPGVQYVGIPEFQDTGSRCTAEISASIAGDIDVDAALDRCQAFASEIVG